MSGIYNNNNNIFRHKSNVKYVIKQVIIGVNGLVTESLKWNLQTTPGKHSIDSLQKTTVLRTSHKTLKVLQFENWRLSGGDRLWIRRRSTREKMPVGRKAEIMMMMKMMISTTVKVHDIFHWRNNITCSTNCKYRTAATLHTLETWFGSST